jgi:hypothetical protein
VNLIVERASQVVEDLAHARSRRAFLSALEHFERMLAIAPDYPRTALTEADGQALGALADTVITQIEERLERHTDRASVQRALASRVYQIRQDVENVYTFVHGSGGSTAWTSRAPAASAPR